MNVHYNPYKSVIKTEYSVTLLETETRARKLLKEMGE
jgi:hypothetical protein